MDDIVVSSISHPTSESIFSLKMEKEEQKSPLFSKLIDHSTCGLIFPLKIKEEEEEEQNSKLFAKLDDNTIDTETDIKFGIFSKTINVITSELPEGKIIKNHSNDFYFSQFYHYLYAREQEKKEYKPSKKNINKRKKIAENKCPIRRIKTDSFLEDKKDSVKLGELQEKVKGIIPLIPTKTCKCIDIYSCVCSNRLKLQSIYENHLDEFCSWYIFIGKPTEDIENTDTDYFKMLEEARQLFFKKYPEHCDCNKNSFCYCICHERI